LEELDFPAPDVEPEIAVDGVVIDGLAAALASARPGVIERRQIPTTPGYARVGWERDGVIYTDEVLEAVQERTRREIAALHPLMSGLPGGVVMTRLGPVLAMMERDWVCYCSPSRSMLMADARRREARARARRAQRRLKVMAGLLAVYALAALVFLLV
jgi:hypothetical protein